MNHSATSIGMLDLSQDALGSATEVAVWQLALAMRESDEAVERLGNAIERIGATEPKIAVLLTRLADEGCPPSVADNLRQRLQDLYAEVSVCIENMQFYDRLIQHLGHLKHYLASIHGVTDSPRDHPADLATLEQANAVLRRRLMTTAQCSLFDRVTCPERKDDLAMLAEQVVSKGNPADGSIEFF